MAREVWDVRLSTSAGDLVLPAPETDGLYDIGSERAMKKAANRNPEGIPGATEARDRLARVRLRGRRAKFFRGRIGMQCCSGHPFGSCGIDYLQ
jgi:hypothetical protein